ncbi:hypothetical protein QTP88_026598 [Uroleucon formosanum]
MIDFEQPFILAFKDVFPNSEIKGCFFHFQKFIWRKIQENGLQNIYVEDAEFSLQIRHLCVLAFVPMDKSVQYFYELIESNYYVENENILSPIINYFEDTWIGRPNSRNGRCPPMFSVNMWNCYESVIQDLPRMNNSVEGSSCNGIMHSMQHSEQITFQYGNSYASYNMSNCYKRYYDMEPFPLTMVDRLG